MKPSASVKSSESCLSAPSSAGSAVSVALSGAAGVGGLRAGEGCDPLEDVAAQFLEFAGKAHDVDQRRAQIVADDVGEALDLVIGLAQVGGALVDRGFEVDDCCRAVSLRLRRGRATRRRTRKIERPASATTRPEPATVTIEASCWVRSAVAVRSSNRRSSSARMSRATSRDHLHGVARRRLAQHRDARRCRYRYVLTRLDAARELREPGFDRLSQLLRVGDLDRVVAD